MNEVNKLKDLIQQFLDNKINERIFTEKFLEEFFSYENEIYSYDNHTYN